MTSFRKFVFLFFFLCLFLSICFLLSRPRPRKNFEFTKIIFTYWEGDKNQIVDRCLQYMDYYSEGFKFIILNKNNIHIADKLLYNLDRSEHRSDFIRLSYLEKYGGIWIDASIVVLRPIYEWLSDMHIKYNIQKEDNDILIGFGCPFDNSIMENWLFYCSSNCSFVKLWKEEYLIAVKIGFKKYCRKNNYILNDRFNSLSTMLPYLTQHLCFCKVFSEKKYNTKVFIQPSCDGPFQYLCKNDMEPAKAIPYLNSIKKRNLKNHYFIKLRGSERLFIDSYLKDTSCKKNSMLYDLLEKQIPSKKQSKKNKNK